MMQGNTKRNKTVGAMVSAAVVILFLGIFLAFLIVPLLLETLGYGMVTLFVSIYAIILLAVMIGILLALRQRLKEIEGGEEDAASQY